MHTHIPLLDSTTSRWKQEDTSALFQRGGVGIRARTEVYQPLQHYRVGQKLVIGIFGRYIYLPVCEDGIRIPNHRSISSDGRDLGAWQPRL